MPRAKKSTKRQIKNYTHEDKERVNNPPVGLVTPDTDKDAGTTTYAYDPHLDPQLVWAGKAEHTSFDVPTVSLHVHERIDPCSIIEAVKKRNGADPQLSLFATPEENPPIRQAIEFYKHKHNWTNRLIAGDSLLVMNSLLEKEGLGGLVQMVYIDPPYGIRYGSNFQPFVNKRDVKDEKDEDLTQEPEMIRAFRDTWELGIHSYLTYLRDRLLLARELLHESGSCFVQIGDENVHLVRSLMDDVFAVDNFLGQIYFQTTTGRQSAQIDRVGNYLVWYAKDIPSIKYRNLFLEKKIKSSDQPSLGDLQSQGVRSTGSYKVEFKGISYKPLTGNHWKVTEDGMKRLITADRVGSLKSVLRYKRYGLDFPVTSIRDVWTDVSGGAGPDKKYVVQTAASVIERCVWMSTDPGDLVVDPTCGSGTTAYVAEQWGRRWITCDTSRVSISIAKQRLMTAIFNYYELAHPEEGVGSGFNYETVPHITLKSIANNPKIREGMDREDIDAAIRKYADEEVLYDRPKVDRSKTRVTGPFTIEAVPAPAVKPLDVIEESGEQPADEAVARTGETLRQGDWRDELFRTGIRGKAGQHIRFARLEPLAATRWLHAEGETRPHDSGTDSFGPGIRETPTAFEPVRVVISFGPDHAPMEQRQVALAIEEAQLLVPKPEIIVFAAFQFDPEAAKDIDETKWPGVTLLKAQMNADLLTEDLKKKRASNESFWLIGQPDVELEKITKGDDRDKYRLSVHGFDYYNTKTGGVESGGEDKIAMWMLDPDYDGRSLFPRQVFFPMAGASNGWAKLARSLKAEIDEDLIEAYRGTVSLPFETGQHKRAAVKIIDDRGIESLKLIGLE